MPSETEAILNAHLCAAEDEVESLKAELQAERERTRVLEEALGEWRERCARLCDPEPGDWRAALDEARASLAAGARQRTAAVAATVPGADRLTLIRRGKRLEATGAAADYEWWQELPPGESAEALRSVGYEVVTFVREGAP